MGKPWCPAYADLAPCISFWVCLVWWRPVHPIQCQSSQRYRRNPGPAFPTWCTAAPRWTYAGLHLVALSRMSTHCSPRLLKMFRSDLQLARKRSHAAPAAVLLWDLGLLPCTWHVAAWRPVAEVPYSSAPRGQNESFKGCFRFCLTCKLNFFLTKF